jgi:succinyl-diaminopimelate desuccinylase
MTSVDAMIERGRERLVASLRELVRIPTVNPPGRHYGRIVEHLVARCESLGLTTRTIPVPPSAARRVVPHADEYPRTNVLARWHVGARRTVHFNAHYDVVPTSGGWRVDPFGGDVKGRWLYGRGSDDMKDSIAALLFALEVLRESGIAPAFNVECSFTADEETGGQLGAGWLDAKRFLRADAVVSCEGGSGLTVGYGHNGVLWLRVAVHGRAAHASNPNAGLNAFEKMTELVTALQALKQRFDAPERVFRTVSGIERKPTLNIGGVFFGTEGDKENTVPASATFTIDRRIPPNETLADAESELRQAMEDAQKTIPDLRFDVTRTLGIEPCRTDPAHPFAQEFARVVRSVRRRPVRFGLTSGFTDLHYLVGAAHRPGVGYGPSGEGGHGANERSRLDDLVAVTRIYARFIACGAF